MNALHCPACKRVIPEGDINVGTDIALCRACGATHSFSDLVEASRLDGLGDRPVPGTWQDRGIRGTVIGGLHRSLAGALGLLAFSLFWNGIVSVFVACALSGTLHLLAVPVPEWMPAPKMNGAIMGWGTVLFLWLFLTPFIAIGAGMIWGFLSCLAGKTEIRLGNGGPGVIFTGIGPLGWRREFDPRGVRQVRLKEVTTTTGKGGTTTQTYIVLEMQNGKELKFGSTLPAERRTFVAAALRKALTGI